MADATLTGIPITHPPGIPTHGGHQSPAPQVSPQARHAAEEFESVFLTEMMQPMFEGIGTDGLGEGGEGEEMFRPMLIQQYASSISKAGGVGIAVSILHELSRMQSAVTPTNGATTPVQAQANQLSHAAETAEATRATQSAQAHSIEIPHGFDR